MALHKRRPSAVRGGRAPNEYGGDPGGKCGCTCGISVATGTSSNSPASAGPSVRMSATTACGLAAATWGRVSRAARTTAS